MPTTADPWGALVDPAFAPVPGTAGGPLAGTRFVAKDLVDVAGTVTGAGQPTWAATHQPAPRHATVVARLLAAGATLVGKAHTAEMAYSLSGANAHHGMPVNPRFPALDPGGSSSGSAAAVAGGLADLGLATDTLGSVRVPASSCGLFGWRPTHGLVPDDGVHPLAPSLDTVGLLARDPALLAAAAAVLADGLPAAPDATRLLLAEDALALLAPPWSSAFATLVEDLAPAGTTTLAPPGTTLADLTLLVRDIQGPEFAAAHRTWIETATPSFGPGVAERIAHALAVTPAQAAAAEVGRDRVRSHLAAVLGPGAVIVAPAGPPPAGRDAHEDERARARAAAAGLSVVASLAGCPVVVVPGVVVDGHLGGWAFVGAPGSDAGLLRLAAGRPPVPSATGRGSP